MSSPECVLCGKAITEDEDCEVLTCIAARGSASPSHVTSVHAKCWEKHKKQHLRSGAGRRIHVNFFCPVAGCHNALHGQHTSVRAVEPKVERKAASSGSSSNDGGSSGGGGGGGGEDSGKSRVLTDAERRKREAALGLLEECDDYEGKCVELKQDGTRCGKPIFDVRTLSVPQRLELHTGLS